MKEIFYELEEILSSLSDQVFLDCGLLLKKIRGDDLFPSSDIDFGVLSNYRGALLSNLFLFEKKGYKVDSIGGYKRFFEGIKLTKIDAAGNLISCDIYFYYQVGCFYVHPNSHKPVIHGLLDKEMFRLFKKIQDLYDCLYVKKSLMRFLFVVPSYVLGFCYFSFFRFNQFRFPDVFFQAPHVSFSDGTLRVGCLQEARSYLRWRYGDAWAIRDKEYRFSDGWMLYFSGGLQLFLQFLKAPTDTCLCGVKDLQGKTERVSQRKNVSSKSPFQFSKSEISIVLERMQKVEEQGRFGR